MKVAGVTEVYGVIQRHPRCAAENESGGVNCNQPSDD